MKKKILSLLLVMAMLLSIVPMAGATDETAEPKFTGYNLFLQNSIAICFEANRAAIEEGFEKVEFYIGEELVQTRTVLPEADANGNVYFRCTKLTPAQMGEDVTAKLYIGGEMKHEFSASVKDYCMTILNNVQNFEAWKDADLRTMLVDLLNYGAATQTFAQAITPLVNADLSTEQKALATAGNLKLTNVCDVFEYANLTAPTVTWYGVGLNLKDSITLCYEFVAESIEKLAIHFFNDDNSLDVWVTKFEQVEGTEDHYYAYFGMLDPTQLSETISAVAYTNHYSSNRNMESHKLLYSAESYAYAVANGTYSAELKALTDAMMRYGDAVCRWNCDHGEYKNGRCAVCELEKVFTMTTDTITIQAEDAILNMTGTTSNQDRIMENPNAAGGKIVKMQAAYSGTYTDWSAANYEGSIIVKFIPKLSGTYTVSARVIDNGGALGGMVAAVDDVTTKYTRQGITETNADLSSYDAFSTTDKFVSGPIGTSYEFVAGKTYAIRILSTSANLAFDEFVITHVHTYDDDNDPTCNGCGEGRHVHTKEIESDDTHHWYNYTCGCTDLDESKVEHSYTNGTCECGKVRVFAMNGTSITINAEDVVLNTNYVELITNNNVAGRKLVKVNNAHSAYINGAYVTSAEHPGDIIVYVTPSVSGTYKVEATGVYTKSVTLAGVLVEDDTTTSATTFTYKALPNPCSTPGDDFANGSIIPMTYGTEYQWTAGKTYAIRIASGCARAAIDQFVISHVHTYTNGVCACGDRKVAATTNGFAVIEAEDWQASTTYATKTANAEASGGYIVKLSTQNPNAASLNGTSDVEASIDVCVKPDTTGQYYIWVRMGYYSKGGCNTWVSGDTWEATSESGYKYIAFNQTTCDEGSTTIGWQKFAVTPQWTAGNEYHIKIATWSTYTGIDQFVITTDANYTPGGIVAAG